MNSSKAWWLEPKGKAHSEVFGRVDYLHTQNAELRADNLLYLAVHSNFNVDGSGSYGELDLNIGGQKMRRNVVQAVCDTAASLIAANKTIPSYSTSKGEGSFSLARKAYRRGLVIAAQMWQLDAWNLGVDAFYDGAVCGTGITHGYIDPETGRPKLVRVEPNSLFTDQAEGRNPRSLYWVHFVAREQLLAQYPEYRVDIESAAGPTANDMADHAFRYDNTADLVRVVESWHLSPGGKKGKGRHVVCVSNATLWDAPYSRQRFPFAFYHYALRRGRCFWGQGLVERVLPAQLELVEIMETVRKAQRLSGPVYLADENSNIHVEDFTNEVGRVMFYRGNAPQQVVWQATPQDLVARARELVADVYEQEGLSPGVVGGELPQKGLSSARAVRAADDVASRRLVLPTRNMEGYYLQTAKLLEDLNDDCAELDPAYSVTGFESSGRQNFLASSKWADLALPEGEATLKVQSMSAVPTTPQGRISALEEYIQSGFMSKAHAIQLMELGGDTSTWSSLETADLDLVEWQIERLLDGQPELPIEAQDPALAADLVKKAYLVAYRMEAPDEVLAAFESYLAQSKAYLEAAQATQQPAPEEMTADPGAMAAMPAA